MNRCIYFKKAEPELTFEKDEHIMPAGMGGVRTLPKGMVSDEANELFSKLELDFMRNSIISIPRQFYGPGKRGSIKKKDATKSGVHLLSCNGIETDLSLGYIELGIPHIIPQIKVKGETLNFHTEEIKNSREEDLYEFIKNMKAMNSRPKKIIDREVPDGQLILGHLKDKRQDNWYMAGSKEEDFKKLTDVMEKLKEEGFLDVGEVNVKKSTVTSHQKMAFNIESFLRVCAKIAFNHLAFYKGSEFVLRDIFDPIRGFILTGGQNRFVGLMDNLERQDILEKLSQSKRHRDRSLVPVL